MATGQKTKQVARIKEMEAALDASAEALDHLEAALRKFKRTQPKFAKLSAYYGSEQWFTDREAYEADKLPANLKCGVLSEDAPYDVLVSYHDQTIRMLEAATKALKII